MRKPLPSFKYLNVLKSCILTKSGVQAASPSDCKVISTLIKKSTGRSVSETTIKRFLGFAEKQFNFSIYTLNTLCEFAGYAGWEHFCNTVPEEDNTINHTMWEEFRQKSLTATRITVKTLKNRTGIPFEYTVSRAAKEADFNYFLKSKYQLFCLVAPPGMGKTTQLVHLVDDFFLSEKAPYKDSIIWFFRSVQSFEQFERENDFNFIEYFKNQSHQVNGKVAIVLDGFDEPSDLNEKKQTDLIFQKIIDLLCYYKGLNWLKIILSLRTSTWTLLKERFIQSECIRQTWFSGIFYNKQLKTNLLPLEKKEVCHVMKSIKQATSYPPLLNTALYSLFSYPYYIYLYYELLKKKKHMVLRGDALFCELVTSFAYHKIHRSTNNIKKEWLIRKLVRLKDYGKSDEPIEKRVLLGENDTYISAYNELIKEGILQEKDNNQTFTYRLYVRFLHEPLYTYFIAIELIDKNDDADYFHLFKKITSEYQQPERRKMLFKWILWYSPEESKNEILKLFDMGELSIGEKGYILICICDLLENDPRIMNESQKTTLLETSLSFLSKNFLELNDLGRTHEEILKTLLHFSVKQTHTANLLILLGVLSLVHLDKEELSHIIIRLNKLDKKIFPNNYPIDPLRALEFIYEYYTYEYYTGQSSRSDFPDTIDVFIKNSRTKIENKAVEPEYLLSYQLAVFIFMLTRPAREMKQLTDIVRQSHPSLFLKEQYNGISSFLLMRDAFAYLRNAMNIQAIQITEELQGYNKRFREEKSYSINTLLYKILQGEIAVIECDYTSACKLFYNVYEACKKRKYVILQAYTAFPLIKIYKLNDESHLAFKVMEDIRQTLESIHFPVEDILLTKIMEEA